MTHCSGLDVEALFATLVVTEMRGSWISPSCLLVLTRLLRISPLPSAQLVELLKEGQRSDFSKASQCFVALSPSVLSNRSFVDQKSRKGWIFKKNITIITGSLENPVLLFLQRGRLLKQHAGAVLNLCRGETPPSRHGYW